MSCLKELKQYLPIIDDETFKVHVNEQKNDIAKWLEQISKPFGVRMSSVKDKNELIKQINEWKGKEPEPSSPAPKQPAEAKPKADEQAPKQEPKK